MRPPDEASRPGSGARVPARALFDEAQAHHRAGRLEHAARLYTRIVQGEPRHAEAWHFLGVIACQQGQAEKALPLIRRALALTPGAAMHANLGLALMEVGELRAAAESLQRALALDPDQPEAHYNLGLVYERQRKLDDAERSFRRAASLDPGHAQALDRLGAVMHVRERLDEAVEAYRRALSVRPDHVEALEHLGRALLERGELEAGIECLQRTLERAPEHTSARNHLARAFRQQGRLEEALVQCRRALELEPEDADAHRNLGQTLKLLGDLPGACASFERALTRRRAPGAPVPEELFTFTRTTRAKLQHDIEQLEYLLQRGLVEPELEAAVAQYREILAAVPAAAGEGELLDLPPEMARRIAAHYNRLLYRGAAPRVPGGAVNPQLNRERIESNYARNAPGITHVDDFLTSEALLALRRFCLESTLWFDFNHRNGYVGAYLQDGFYCPLLLQIATELPRALPGIFGQHSLTQLWAYKYDSRLDGIELHADFAAVNVNFWLTPDTANLDPDSGGLIVWDREAPAEWSLDRYNSSRPAAQSAVAGFLHAAGARETRIPHRQNRVVIFNSDLFHRTDTIRFKEGYENRRINITMLYGDRADNP